MVYPHLYVCVYHDNMKGCHGTFLVGRFSMSCRSKTVFQFPILQMVAMVLEHFEIAPSQLMPNSWQLLLALQVLTERHDIMFGMPELLHGYFIREHDGEKCRFSLNARKKIKRLIIGLNSGDKGWKGSYFLASGDLVLSRDYRFPLAWSRGRRLSTQPVEGLLVNECISKILAISESQRDCWFLLSSEVLASSSLWAHAFGRTKSHLSLCGPLNSTEREVADHVMSRVIGSSLDALERRKAKEKKKSKTRASSTGPVDPPASSYGLPSQTELPDDASSIVRKRKLYNTDFWRGWFDRVFFPADSSAFSNPGVVALGEGLLFPEDRVRYEELGQVKAAEKELTSLKESSGAHISSLEDRLENCQLEVEIATRAFVMNEHKKGKYTSWEVDKAIAEYAELCQMLGMLHMLEKQSEDEVRGVGPSDDGNDQA
ncbi:Uncharacterized protein Adt_34653 [Abeliophyllum distichum]|uniref:Uncharacterized protein n=1 Tax=Abeliophyllum distichum TaxID=126358 RepID=A0ABD1R0Y6_9LAMI